MGIDIRALLAKLNAESRAAMTRAAEFCVQQTHFNVELEHLLSKLLDGPTADLECVFRFFEIDPQQVDEQLQRTMDGFKRGNARTPALSPHFGPLFQEAWVISSMLLGEQQIRSASILLALLEVDALRGLLIDMAPSLLQIPREKFRDQFADIICESSEDVGNTTISRDVSRAATSVEQVNSPLRPVSRKTGTPSLDQFTIDLTAQAASGSVDTIKGRDSEIRQIIDVLLRRRQNNPILTGEAGVGKTAVVEGFAQRIVDGLVPPSLLNVSIRSLDLGLLQAGAGIKGEFENRLKSVISEVRAAVPPVILFIDEAHQLIGAGGAEGQGDAANLLKPALARGELRTIAATTWSEYKKYVERDPALARRFQVVKVDEPEPEVAVEMLRGMVPTLEKHHGVEILDEAVRDAVRLSHRYITGRQLPDKAVSVLDTACARVAVGQVGVPWQIEALGREIAIAEGELRLARHSKATGSDFVGEIPSIEDRLAKQRRRREKLETKLAEERRAVQEIIALRRKITTGLSNNTEVDGEDDERDFQLARLQRLQKGLEAIHEDEPLVPTCVDSRSVADVISGWTGIPVGKMMADEIRTILQLRDQLAERVRGQDAALDAICRRVSTFRADLDDPGKPVGVFMLVGPSGVGKTETAFALADTLYGGERNMVTINMSEFQEAHSVSSIKGAPPGYVGYGRGGVLTEAVRRRPYCVVLLDEMEKAHPDVLEMFFQVFDKGTMEDGEGVTIDFKNTLILLTSNAAQDVITDACTGGKRPPVAELLGKLRPALLKQFSPAFLGRLVLVPYYPLGDVQVREIVELKLAKLAQRFATNHLAKFTWDEEVTGSISARCTEVDSGARNIDFILTQTILPELSGKVLECIAESRAFDRVHMSIGRGGQFEYEFQNKSDKG